MNPGRRLHSPAEYQKGSDAVIFDFSYPLQTALWLPMNDVVMGGVSTGILSQYTSTTALFRGTVSLDHGGGFSSIRTTPAEFDLSGFRGLTLVVRGDGNRYTWNMTADGSASTVLYQVPFDTVHSQWIAIPILFADLVPTFRGRVLYDHPPLDTMRIRSFGFMISGKQAGRFALEDALITAQR
jgi:NADH dehydrogenase [ubiquinone] 1 alpha subcomplex assembly factor 1